MSTPAGRPARTKCKSIYRVGDDGKTSHPHEEFEDLEFPEEDALKAEELRRSAKKTRRNTAAPKIEAPPPATSTQPFILPFDRQYLGGTVDKQSTGPAHTASSSSSSLRQAFTINGGFISQPAPAQLSAFDTIPLNSRVQIVSSSPSSYGPLQWQRQQHHAHQSQPLQQGTAAQLRGAALSLENFLPYGQPHLQVAQHDQQWRSQVAAPPMQNLHPQYAQRYTQQYTQFSHMHGQPLLQPVQQSQHGQQKVVYAEATRVGSVQMRQPQPMVQPAEPRQVAPLQQLPPQSIQAFQQPLLLLPPQPASLKVKEPITSTAATRVRISLTAFLGLAPEFVQLPDCVHLAIASHLPLEDILATSAASRPLLQLYSLSVVQIFVRHPLEVHAHQVGRQSRDTTYEQFVQNLLMRFPVLRRVVTTDFRCLDGLTSLLNSDACPSLLDVVIADSWTLPAQRNNLRSSAASLKRATEATVRYASPVFRLIVDSLCLATFDLEALFCSKRMAPKFAELALSTTPQAAVLASFLRCARAASLQGLQITACMAGPIPLHGRASLVTPVIEALLCGTASSLAGLTVFACPSPIGNAFQAAYGSSAPHQPLITHPQALTSLRRIHLRQTAADDTTFVIMSTLITSAHKYPNLRELDLESSKGLTAQTILALSDAIFRHSFPLLESLRLAAYVDPDRCDARPDLGNLRIDALVSALAAGICDSTLTRLCLPSCNVTYPVASALALAFINGRCPLLEVLDLSYNNIGENGLTYIISSLPYLSYLRKLNLSHIKATFEGARALSSALKQGAAPRLTLLRLQGWGMTELDMVRHALHQCGRQNTVYIDPAQV